MSANSTFFFAGGTMEPRRPSYIERRADHELYAAMAAGEFCYVLTSRQMGKSSLFSRAAYGLRREGFKVCIIDLQSIGTNVTPKEWFDGMMERLGDDFDLEDEIDAFRKANANLAPMNMWLEVLRRVVLQKLPAPQRIIIVVDEIDLVRTIKFDTDELFLGIRNLHNERANNPDLQRLSFCLLGVASPGDLIQNKDVTPFNIGHRIELRDFTADEALKLADGFDEIPRETAGALVRRVHHWAGGQPFLTQKICGLVAANAQVRDAAGVDRLVSDFYLTQKARETDPHFVFIGDRLDAQRRKDPAGFERVMLAYRRVLRQRRVRDSETATEVSRLKLAGLVKGNDGWLACKSPIHATLFGEAWLRQQLPHNWRRITLRLSAAAALVALIGCVPLAIWLGKELGKQQDLNKEVKQKLEGIRKKEEEVRIDLAKARIEAAEAGKSLAVSQEQIRAATDKQNEAAESARLVTASLGKSICNQINTVWRNGRHIVEGAFLFADATDPKGELKLKPAAIPLIPEAMPKTSAAGSEAPAGWSKDRMFHTWLEPLGSYKAAGAVHDIMPWPGGPGMLVVTEADDKDQVSLYGMRLVTLKESDARQKPALRRPAKLRDLELRAPGFRLVRSLALSSDGGTLALVDGVGELYAWTEDGSDWWMASVPKPKSERPHSDQPETPLRLIAFVPGGTRSVVAGWEGGLWLCETPGDLKGGAVLDPADADRKWTAITVSPDGRSLLAGDANGAVTEWNLPEQRRTGRDWKLPDAVGALAFSPDGKRFAGASVSGEIAQWDFPGGSGPAVSFTIADGVESLEYSPDGALLAVGGRKGRAFTYDATQPGGPRLNAGLGSATDIAGWSRATSLERSNLYATVHFVRGGAALAVNSAWDRFGIWEVATGRAIVPAVDEKDTILSACVIGAGDRIFRAGIVHPMDEFRGEVRIEQLGADGKLTALTRTLESDSPFIRLVSGFTGATAVCPNRQLIAVSREGEKPGVAVAPAATMQAFADGMRLFRHGSQGVPDGVFIPKSDLLGVAKPKAPANGTKDSRKPPTGSESAGVPIAAIVRILAFSGDGRALAAAFSDGTVALLEDTAGGAKPDFKLRWRKKIANDTAGSIASMAFLSGGSILLVVPEARGSIALHAADGTRESEDNFKPPMASARDGRSHLVARRGQQSAQFLQVGGHDSYLIERANTLELGAEVRSVAFAHDSQWFAIGLEDGSLSIGHAGALVETVPALPGAVTAVSFSPDGMHVFAGGADGRLRAFRLREGPEPVIPGGASGIAAAKQRWGVSLGADQKLKAVKETEAEDNSRDAATPQPVLDSARAAVIETAARWSENIERAFTAAPAPIALDATTAPCAEVIAFSATPHLQWSLRDASNAMTSLQQCCAKDFVPNGETIEKVESLPVGQRWALLYHRADEWAEKLKTANPQLAARIALAYAKTEATRLDFAESASRAKPDAPVIGKSYSALPNAWAPSITRATGAIQTAFQLGLRREQDYRDVAALLATPALSKVKAQMAKVSKASDEFDRASADADTDAKRKEVVRLYKKLLAEGGQPNALGTYHAFWAAYNLRDYTGALEIAPVAVRTAEDDEMRGAATMGHALAISKMQPTERRKDALELAKKATQFAPKIDWVWNERGDLLRATVKGEEPEEVLKPFVVELRERENKLTEGNEKIPLMLRVELIKTLLKLEKSKEAMDEAERTIASAPRDAKTYHVIWEKITAPDAIWGKWLRTQFDTGLAIASKPGNSERRWFFQRHGADLRGRGDYHGSVLALLTAREAGTERDAKDIGGTLTALGETLRRLGLMNDAAKCLEAGREFDLSASAKEKHAFVLQRLRKDAEAEKLLRECPADYISSEGGTYGSKLVMHLARTGRGKEAQQVIMKKNEAENLFALLHWERAWLARFLALQSPPDDAAALQKSSLADMKQAEENWLLQKPRSKYLLSIAGTAAFRDDFAAARALFAEYRKLWPDDTAGLLLREARILAAEGTPEGRELAIGKVALAIALGDYDWFRFQCDVQDAPLHTLTGFDELIALLPVQNAAELSAREERLAEWFAKQEVADDEAKKLLAAAADKCRKRAALFREKPIVLDWAKILPSAPKVRSRPAAPRG